MSPFELLKQDHRQVARILKRIETLKPGTETEKQELSHELGNDLRLHADLEEQVFYPELQKLDQTRALALEAIEEHRLVKQLLNEMEKLPPGSEQWNAKFAVLKENVEHHVAEEEGEIFSIARQAMNRQQISDLGKRLQEAKAAGEATV